MQPFKITSLIFIALLGLPSCQSTEELQKPNIIVFLVDDLGWQDTSVPFHSDTTVFNRRYHTPGMERLSREGMRFTNAYAACVCSPSRISLMTGMNAARHRVTNWTLKRDTKTDGRDSILNPPDWNYNGLNVEPGINNTVVATPLPALLRDHGYQTIHIGKAHFAAIGTPCAEPKNCGFDVNVAGHAAGAPGSYNGLTYFGNNPDGTARNNWSVPGLEKYFGQDISLTEALTQEAISIIDSSVDEGQPFFLYMSHYTVHTPIQEDNRYFQKYLTSGLDTIESRYASMVEGMDRSLRDILEYLDEKQIGENTIILFMSDNGGLSAVARGGQRHLHNAPLASGKGSAYEGGVREPMIVKWPGEVREGSICDQPVIIEDFFTTILDMAGVDALGTIQSVDGQSFIPALKEDSSIDSERPIIWHYPNIWGPSGPGIGAYSALRQGDWKLIYFHEGRIELYNLAHDLPERVDLFDKHLETAEALTLKLGNYLREVGAQMPTMRSSSDHVAMPDVFFEGMSK